MSTSLVGFCKGIDQRKKGRRTYAEQLPGRAPVHACVECKSKNLPRARKASSSFARRRSAGNALAGPVATEYVEGATGKRRSWRGRRTTTERERGRGAWPEGEPWRRVDRCVVGFRPSSPVQGPGLVALLSRPLSLYL